MFLSDGTTSNGGAYAVVQTMGSKISKIGSQANVRQYLRVDHDGYIDHDETIDVDQPIDMNESVDLPASYAQIQQENNNSKNVAVNNSKSFIAIENNKDVKDDSKAGSEEITASSKTNTASSGPLEKTNTVHQSIDEKKDATNVSADKKDATNVTADKKDASKSTARKMDNTVGTEKDETLTAPPTTVLENPLPSQGTPNPPAPPQDTPQHRLLESGEVQPKSTHLPDWSSISEPLSSAAFIEITNSTDTAHGLLKNEEKLSYDETTKDKFAREMSTLQSSYNQEAVLEGKQAAAELADFEAKRAAKRLSKIKKPTETDSSTKTSKDSTIADNDAAAPEALKTSKLKDAKEGESTKDTKAAGESFTDASRSEIAKTDHGNSTETPKPTQDESKASNDLAASKLGKASTKLGNDSTEAADAQALEETKVVIPNTTSTNASVATNGAAAATNRTATTHFRTFPTSVTTHTLFSNAMKSANERVHEAGTAQETKIAGENNKDSTGEEMAMLCLGTFAFFLVCGGIFFLHDLHRTSPETEPIRATVVASSQDIYSGRPKKSAVNDGGNLQQTIEESSQ